MNEINLTYLELKSDQIKYINKCKNFKTLYYHLKGFKDMSIVDKLNKNIKIK